MAQNIQASRWEGSTVGVGVIKTDDVDVGVLVIAVGVDVDVSANRRLSGRERLASRLDWNSVQLAFVGWN